MLIGVKIILNKRREMDRDEDEAVFDDNVSTDRLSESNVFGDVNIRLDSADFQGGSVNNVFGDVRIDLSGVVLQKEIVKLYVNGVFGDITIILPKDVARPPQISRRE